jgi:hypothetical protein
LSYLCQEFKNTHNGKDRNSIRNIKIMTKEISREDVIQVGNDLNKNLSDSTIDWVLKEYDSWAKFDTTSNWSEIVESMLYSN